MRRALVYLWIFFLASLPAVAADSMGRGYTARACGFDLDQNGTIGEVGDCNKICNATTGTGPITSDLDSDGDNEEEYYVDCDAGSNSDTGGPSDPFLTLTYALTQLDGVGDSAEDIVCFKGTCTDEVDLWIPPGDSAQSYWTRTKTGNQVRDWRYPQDPGMIVGWDADNDGSYPPFDTDDTAILDGSGLVSDFYNFDLNGIDYTQMGHFSIDNYAYHNLNNNDCTQLFAGSNAPEYARIHDIEVDSWNEGGCAGGCTRVIDNGTGHVYGAFENIDFNDIQGKFMRGGASYSVVNGPVRIQNISWTVKAMYDQAANTSCNTGADGNITLGRSWGVATGYEILDSRFDANLDQWFSSEMSANQGHAMSQCLWDWDVINNYYKDIAVVVAIDAGDNFFCTTEQGGRITKDLNIERVEWDYGHAVADGGFPGIPITSRNADCYDGNAHDGSLRVVNNMFITHSGASMKYGIIMGYGSSTDVSTTTGETLIANNTFNIDLKDYDNGAIILVTPSVCLAQYTHDIRIYNNIINGLESGERAVTIDDAWTGTLEMGNNIYESIATNGFLYDGTKYHSLSTWQSATSLDANSDTCIPTFLSGASNFHLDTSDTCAQENGVSMAADFTDDFDGDARPQGTYWDIGADEYESGYSPPDGACCTGASCALTTEANCAGGVWQGADTVCSPNPCSEEDPPLGGELAGVTLSGVSKE